MQAVTITQITPPELESLIENSLMKILLKQPNKEQIEPDQLLTIQQASEFLNLSVPTLYGYVHKSLIPVCKGSKRLYFSKKELIDWIKIGRKKTLLETQLEADKYLKTSKK